MLCPRPSRIRPRRAVTFVFLLFAAYHLSAFLFSPTKTPRRPSELSGHKGYLRAVGDGTYGFGHRGLMRDGIGDAEEEEDALDNVPDDEDVAVEDVAVFRHDPNIMKSPATPSDDINLSILTTELDNLAPSLDDSSDEPLIHERLNPAPRTKDGKKTGGRMENMRKAVVVTGPNAAKARRVRRLIRRYANTWYQRYVLAPSLARIRY